MPSNKDRIYVALYARGGGPKMPGLEDTYHWSLVVGPKHEIEDGQGMRYHAKERVVGPAQMQWIYEEKVIPLIATNMLLVRIMIGKVTNMERLTKTLRGVPIVQGDPEWNCVSWVKDALEALQADGKALGTCQIGWETVRDAAMDYCQEKKDQHRFDGTRNFDTSKAPTYDLLERCEVIS